MNKLWLIIITVALIITFTGCSNGGDIIVPELMDTVAASSANSHQLWGLWQFTADPVNETLDVVQLRASDMHLNALPFLEPPALVNLSLESLEFNGNIIEAGIGLRHPFLGLTEFTGFDVCGIFISNGSISGFDDPGLMMAGDNDTRLLNPDGLTRWWNPSEFPVNTGTIWAYNDGLLGTPDSFADYNCTLNGYKYFCDDLEENDPLSLISVSGRGQFSSGQKNIRHYTIELGTEGLTFNYAVDACWEFPSGESPWIAPEDFGENANRPEAYRITVTETENSLYNDGVDNGGDLGLSIDVYDWYYADLNTVIVESPGNFDMQSSSTATGGGTGYSTYEIDITDATPAEGSIDLLVSVESEAVDYGGLLPGETVTAYFMHTAAVEGEAPPECDPPTTPVLVDSVNMGYLPPIAIDMNNVIHMIYADLDHIYWSYSEDCGQTWENMGSIYEPPADLNILVNSLSTDCGKTEPYLYISWAERVPQSEGYGNPNVTIGRLPIDPIGGPIETHTVWHRTNLYYEYIWSTTQLCVLADDDIMLLGCIRPGVGQNYPMYQQVSDFADFNLPTEKLLDNHFVTGDTIYIYFPYMKSVAGDSSGIAYFACGGIYANPAIGSSYDEGTFIIKYDESSDLWDWEYCYENAVNIYYPDNHQTGLYVSPDDHIYCVSEYQTGGTGPYGRDGGIYYMIFIEGPIGGTYNLTNPIPDHVSAVPSPYTNAHRDYEYVCPCAVADSNGLCYVTYERSWNDKTAYYITYDGTDWNHTLNPVQINTTTNAYMPHAIRGYEDWVYMSYAAYTVSGPSVPVFRGFQRIASN